MVRFPTEAAAAADGFQIVHQSERHRFVVLTNEQVVGEAHYRLLGDSGIDFDHTFVRPDLRGTGLSTLLAHHAVTHQVTFGRRVAASCWFIEGYLAKHPDLLDTTRQ